MNGIQITCLSRLLGHSSIQTTLIHLKLVPGPVREPSTVCQEHMGAIRLSAFTTVLYSYAQCRDSSLEPATLRSDKVQ